MKEHILDLIIIETNIDHTKIWEDYFSNKYEIKTFNSLDNSLENKKIFNKNIYSCIPYSHFCKYE